MQKLKMDHGMKKGMVSSMESIENYVLNGCNKVIMASGIDDSSAREVVSELDNLLTFPENNKQTLFERFENLRL